MRFGIDTLEDTSNPQAREKYITRLSDDISEMENLVSSLLEYAQLDHVLEKISFSYLPLESLIATCIERNSCDTISTTLDMQGQHLIKGNENHFAMLLGNLLQNAQKYAKQSVHVELKSTDIGMRITVSDDGPGIPESLRQTVLMPFTRGENNNTEKGHGLGLAIVNRIAQRYGGSVEIDTCPKLLGARITIVFSNLQDN